MAKQLKITSLAEELREIRKQMAEIKMTTIDPLKEKADQLSEMLIKELTNQGWKNVKLDTGEVFTKAVRQSLQITDETLALKWGIEHEAIKVDTTKATKIMRRQIALPDGFEMKETEYLSVRSGSDADGVEEN